MNHKFWITGAIIIILLNTAFIFVPGNDAWWINIFYLIVGVIFLFVVIKNIINDRKWNG